MYKVPEDYEINNLAKKTVQEYVDKVIKKLSDEYQQNQKIPYNNVIDIMNKVYDSDIEPYFFNVEE